MLNTTFFITSNLRTNTFRSFRFFLQTKQTCSAINFCRCCSSSKSIFSFFSASISRRTDSASLSINVKYQPFSVCSISQIPKQANFLLFQQETSMFYLDCQANEHNLQRLPIVSHSNAHDHDL